jgi:tetratricopeptide (TPR) repeat protein
MMPTRIVPVVCVGLFLGACGAMETTRDTSRALGALTLPDAQGGLEGISPLGRQLISRPDSAQIIATADRRLEEAPEDVERIIAAGIARASRWQYTGAIELYDYGLALEPDHPVLYRHRGHRFISTRRFDRALSDLERAATLDSLSFDIAYHLGLAHYLAGDFDRAAAVYGSCMARAQEPAALELEASGRLGDDYRSCMRTGWNDDSRVAIADWRYRALRRAGRHAEARDLLDSIHEDMDVGANISYHRAFMFYKGLRSEEETLDPATLAGNQFQTIGYGIANWYLVEGDTSRAQVLMKAIVRGEEWPAFGMIAAESDLIRLGVVPEGR